MAMAERQQHGVRHALRVHQQVRKREVQLHFAVRVDDAVQRHLFQRPLHAQHIGDKSLRRLPFRDSFARHHTGRIADPVGPHARAALIRLQAASLVIGDQFQPLNGGMKRLETGQRGGDSQHRPDKAALND